MIRQTYRDAHGKPGVTLRQDATGEEARAFGRRSLNTLCAYEETGLEPAEIIAMQAELTVYLQATETIGGYIVGVDVGKCLGDRTIVSAICRDCNTLVASTVVGDEGGSAAFNIPKRCPHCEAARAATTEEAP